MSTAYLHSTMLLLIRSTTKNFLIPDYIYIPLCFYLYASPHGGHVVINEFTFHYASTYTNSCLRPHGNEYIIYIPLCFYLYCPYRLVCTTFKKIYIPLCFYLYCMRMGEMSDICKFTFHYASTYTSSYSRRPRSSYSIYIPLCFYLYCRYLFCYSDFHKFTFHYASTYTDSKSGYHNFRISIYIPLCFYLYFSVRFAPNIQCIFTFHYASTYTTDSDGYH